MSTNAEWIKNSEGKRIYPVSHSSVIVRNHSTVDRDLTALENKADSFEESIGDLEQIVQGNAWIILGKALYGGEVTIPAVGWEKEGDLYVLEIENTKITESTIPIVAISPESYSIALECGLKPYCRTYDGKMKLYAESEPITELVASIGLIGENTTTGRGLQVNSLTGAIDVNPNVVVMNDDLVNEDQMTDDINSWLND